MSNTPHRHSPVSNSRVRISAFGCVSVHRRRMLDYDVQISSSARAPRAVPPDTYDRPGPPETTFRPHQTTARRPPKTAYDRPGPATQNKGPQPNIRPCRQSHPTTSGADAVTNQRVVTVPRRSVLAFPRDPATPSAAPGCPRPALPADRRSSSIEFAGLRNRPTCPHGQTWETRLEWACEMTPPGPRGRGPTEPRP